MPQPPKKRVLRSSAGSTWRMASYEPVPPPPPPLPEPRPPRRRERLDRRLLAALRRI